jgi:cytochrome b561
MRWHNSASGYGVVPMLLHWLVVLGIIVQYVLAESAESKIPADIGVFAAGNLHRSIGILLLALVIARLAWRFIEPPPPWPATTSSYERTIARIVHVTFYVLLFAVPLSGWALATADGQRLSFFGWFDLPALRLGTRLLFEGGALGEEQLEELHEVLFGTLFVLALVHVAAVLKHELFDRGGALRRML